MDFDFSFEQRLLGESVGRMLDELPEVQDRPFPYTAADAVRAASALGLFEMADGAPAIGHVDAVAAALEIGRRLPAAPLTEMLAASLSLAPAEPAMAEALAAATPCGIAVSGTLEIADGRAAGRVLVPFAGETRRMAVPARLGGVRRWLVIETAAASLKPADIFDVTTDASWATFSDLPTSPSNAPRNDGFDDVLALLALAEMTGSAAKCLDMTVAYVKERTQFGKAIGQNQAVKHMAADAAVDFEAMKAAVEYAAWCRDDDPDAASRPGSEASLALLAARSFVGDRARRVAEACLQMHGGIAFTWDYGLHRFLKRINHRRSTLARPREGRETLAATLIAEAAPS